MQKLLRPQKITSEIVTVTPDMAEAWLEKNENNRYPSKSVIAKFARDMKAADWQLTGDAIRFDTDGRLLDGQHRLMACIRADAPFTTFVMYGLDPLTQDVMDTGKPRRIADVLSLRGITNATLLGGTLRALVAYRDGIYSIRTATISTAAMIHAFERHPNITKSVTLCANGMPKASPRAAIAIMHYLASFHLDQGEAADRMIQVFRTGIPSYDGDVIHVLRERFIRFSGAGQRLNQEIASATVLYAWNLFVEQKTIAVLRWQKGFVEIDGIDRSKL